MDSNRLPRIGYQMAGAYARTDLLERRRQLMENWSRYLDI